MTLLLEGLEGVGGAAGRPVRGGVRPTAGQRGRGGVVLRDAVPQPVWDGSNEFLAAIYAELMKGFDGTAAMRTACEAAAAAGDQELRRQGRV